MYNWTCTWEITIFISYVDLGNVTTWNILENKSVSTDSDVLNSWITQLPSYQARTCVVFCLEWVFRGFLNTQTLSTINIFGGGSRITQRGHQSVRRGVWTYFAIFSQQLHKNEQFLAGGGRGEASLPPLNPLMQNKLRLGKVITVMIFMQYWCLQIWNLWLGWEKGRKRNHHVPSVWPRGLDCVWYSLKCRSGDAC